MTDPIEKPVLTPGWASLRDAMESLRNCVAVMHPGQNLPLSRESANDLANLIDGALKMVADVVGHDADVVKLRTVDVAGLTGHHDQHACLHVFDVGSRVKHILYGAGVIVGYETATLAHAHIARPGTLLWLVNLDNGTNLRAPTTKLENIETDIAEREADLSITSDLTGGSRLFVPEHGRFYPEHPVEVRPQYHHDFEITDLISHPTFGVGEVMKIDEYGWIDVKRNGNIYTLRPSGFQILAKMAKETVGVDPKPDRTPSTSESGVHDNPIVRAVVADLEGGDKSLIGAAFQRWADRDF